MDATLTGATRLADGRIVLVTQEGHILTSADGGVSFRPSRRAATSATSSVAAAGGDRLVLVGAEGAGVERLDRTDAEAAR